MAFPLLLGSNNAKKRNELAAILKDLPIEISTPAELGDFEEPVEDGATFLDNAKIKAFHYAGLTGLPTLADDSGLAVDALGGRPGVHSSRYAGEAASDLDNCNKLLHDLKDVPPGRRGARFVCFIAVVNDGELVGTSEGSCEGEILEAMTGSKGFGYDPLFFYPPEGRTFAELGAGIKNRLSHRAGALEGIRPVLESMLGRP
jgi:XTP/dITP diphosphohydrolase